MLRYGDISGDKMGSGLPPTKAARVDWVIHAPDNAELRRRYDLWAASYDGDMGLAEEYPAPAEVAQVAGTVLARTARILDAGAGTGLLGAALRMLGFRALVAVDYSEAMLEVARGKAVYAEHHVRDLSRPTGLAAGSFDAVVSSGATSQIPATALREFVRLLRPGGLIVFGVATDDWARCGWAGIRAGLEAEGAIALVSRSAPFQMMPAIDPDLICEVWVFEVT